MELREIYKKGEAELKTRDIGWLLDGVETEFVMSNNRRVLDQYTIKQQCIDGVEPVTLCTVLGVELKTPVIMSSMTMPIPAIVDKRHQYQHGSLGGKWRSRQVFQGHRSALVFCDMWIHGKIDMGSSCLLPLKLSPSAELNQDRVATAAEFLSQHLCRHTGWTPRGQIDESVGEAAGLGESDVAVKPQAVSAESRDRTEGVPLPVVSETAVVSRMVQKATEGRNGIVHFGCKRFDHPAWLFREQGDEALFCL